MGEAASLLPEGGLLETGAALIEVGPWELIRARGNDRVAFLHRLLTGRIEGVPPGQGGRTMLLTTKGHPVADLLFFVCDAEIRLLAPPGQGAATAAALGRYAVMDDVVAELAPEQRLLAVHGPRAVERLGGAGLPIPPELASGPPFSHSFVSGPPGSFWIARVPGFGADGWWLFGPPEEVAGLGRRLEEGGLPTVGADRAEALRILAGEPRFGTEITADYFPMEVGRTSAIDYGKGCFLGQEPIVRIRDRGHTNWRLVGLRFAEPATVAPGDRLETDVKPKAGRVTSVALLPDGRPVALGLLHVSVPAGTEALIRHGEDVGGRASVVALDDV
jgi:tRNA-modifying protein YgfZ